MGESVNGGEREGERENEIPGREDLAGRDSDIPRRRVGGLE